MYREKGNHIITAVTEHKAVARHVQAPREGRLPRHLPAGAEGRPGRPRRAARGDHRQDDPHLDHDREQRDRRRPADRRDRRDREGEGDPVPHRRGAGGRQDSVRRQRAEGRPGVDHRPQDVRPEGRRRAVRAPAEPARAAGAADRRRRPRARHALRHAQRARHRRLRQGGGAVPPGDGEGDRAAQRARATG